VNRVVLITGVAGSIGGAIAEAFAAAGFGVVGCDRETPRAAASSGRFVSTDLTDPQAAAALVAEVGEREGRLDVLVNNAGVQIAKGVVDTTLAEWDEVLAVNLRAPFLLAREGHRWLRRQGGAIVNVASVHAVATSQGMAAYAASKGGLVALTRALALEFAADGIRVNAVLPGAIDTPMLEAGLGRGRLAGADLGAGKAGLASRTPLGRLGRPEDVAQAVLFLADGRRSGFVTGQVLVADGGATARLSTE